MARRLGELLGDQVPLSTLDVEEVLVEQARSARAFGEVALELGLCTPEHVWRAWAEQLLEGPRYVDLDRVGIDARALYALPTELALEYRVIPVRQIGEVLIVAAGRSGLERARAELPGLLGREVRFAVTEGEDVARALEACYDTADSHC